MAQERGGGGDGEPWWTTYVRTEWQELSQVSISSKNSRGGFFSHQKGAIIGGKVIISNISHRRLCAIYFALLYQAIKERVKYMNITIEKTVKNGAFVTIQLWTIKWKLVCYPR